MNQNWVAVASAEHVRIGRETGIMQICHGKAAPLKRMSPGDWIVYYSPKVRLDGAELCQQFTAIGQIVGRDVYVFEMAPSFAPCRRDVRFLNANTAPIRPLVERLSFITDPKRWGYAFRFGHLEMSREDFELIASKMLGKIPATAYEIPHITSYAAERERLDFLKLKHERWQLEPAAQTIADARFSFDRRTRKREVTDVAVDGAFADLQPFG